MEIAQNILFITYYLTRSNSTHEVVCKGCREIVCLDYKLPSYIKGMIKYEGDYISVIDPNIYFTGQQSMLSNLACILILEYVSNSRRYKTGIIIEDIDEIMSLAADCHERTGFTEPSTFNMSFIFNILKKGQAEQFLSNTQALLDMYEKRKHAIKRSFGHICDDLVREELVEQTEFNELELFFDTNEILVSI